MVGVDYIIINMTKAKDNQSIGFTRSNNKAIPYSLYMCHEDETQ